MPNFVLISKYWAIETFHQDFLSFLENKIHREFQKNRSFILKQKNNLASLEILKSRRLRMIALTRCDLVFFHVDVAIMAKRCLITYYLGTLA